MQQTELPPCDAFYSKLRSCNPLETEYMGYVNLLKSVLTTEEAVIKSKLSKQPPTGNAIYQYLQQIWKQEQMSSFEVFLRWYNKKMLCQLWTQCRKWLPFTATNISIFWSWVVHYQNWPMFVYTNLQMPNFIRSLRPIKTCGRDFKKMLLVALLSFSNGKRLLMKPLIECL